MRASPITAAVVLLPLLIAGCCADPVQETTLTTGPLNVPSATAATGVPAAWFTTLALDTLLHDEALEACANGDLDDLPLTFALVEVTPTRITVAGTDVLQLEGGLATTAEDEGFFLPPLYDQLDGLARASRFHAKLGCSPWITPDLPARNEDVTPLLIAIDPAVPTDTLARVIFTAGQAGYADILLWVDDLTPAPRAPGTTASQDEYLIELDPEGAVRWALHPQDQPYPEFPGDAPFQPTQALADALPAADAPPQAQITLGSGPASTLVDLLDLLAGKDIHCATLGTILDESSPTPASTETPGSERELRRDAVVPVLPLLLPVIGGAPGWEPPTQTLLTGHVCPPIPIPGLSGSTPALLDLLGGSDEDLFKALDAALEAEGIGNRAHPID